MSDSWRPHQDRLDRIARHQLSMTPGAVHGRMAEASPVKERGRQDNGGGSDVEAVFSYPGYIMNEESPAYVNRSVNSQIGTVIAAVMTGSSSSTFTVYVNGASIGSVTVPGGNRQYAETLFDDGPVLDYGDMITVKATTIGTGAQGASVQVLLEEA